MNEQGNERFLISPFLVFFIIHCSQVGVGVLSFQRAVMKEAGHDSWMSVIVASCVVHVLIWIVYKIFQSAPNAEDIVSLHAQYLGKWLGNLLSVLLLIYFFLLALTVLRTYIEIIQVWMFSLIGAWQFSLIFLLLTYYTVLGGFRVVVGLCFWGVVIPLWVILPMLFFPLEYAHYRNLLPIFDHSLIDIFRGAKAMTVQYLGFEMLLMYYSFLKHPEQSHKWAQWGNAFTTLIYLIVIFISLVFYNEEQVQHIIWPTLTLAKIPEVPFIERMEYIVLSIYVLVIFPIICLAVWSVSRGAKRIFSIKQRKSVPIILSLLFVVSLFIVQRENIEKLNMLTSKIGFYVVIVYIPVLYIYISIAKRFKKTVQQ
ncbi:GerAB/ArcD/ProY family transporter [Thermaerobacillus caldiproteolyticus]|uniref:Spore germination protein (Amino acid permease) n=1 Tax=Thermaerobacillus caldiproteolyticus TaxID=247480 RepID=A0A7W0BXQ3_9BACL|nr:GerAB/ArcD/ProY family transporter [Anoxybacillus caldiproteolyticus]MBA2874238.1 spore germination protein (amino acid permease) [Anoxybacillus caldiproteolyticus]